MVLILVINLIISAAAIFIEKEETSSKPEYQTTWIPKNAEKKVLKSEKVNPIDFKSFDGDISIFNTDFDEQQCSIIKDKYGVIWAFARMDDVNEDWLYITRSTQNQFPQIWRYNIAENMSNVVVTLDDEGYLYMTFFTRFGDYFFWKEDTLKDPSEWEFFGWGSSFPPRKHLGDMTAVITDIEEKIAWCEIAFELNYPSLAVTEGELSYYYTWDSDYPNSLYPTVDATDDLLFYAFQYPDTEKGINRVNTRWGDISYNDFIEWNNFDTIDTYNCSKPSVSGDGTNAVVVYECDKNNNKDLMCSFTEDNGETWTHTCVVNSSADEENPRVQIIGNSVHCLFVKNENLFVTSSFNCGDTWSTPYYINDVVGSVTNRWRGSDIYHSDVVWSDHRDDYEHIMYDSLVYGDIYPELDGPSRLRVKKEYEFSAKITEPQGDDVYYLYDWGDGNISDWVGPFSSGETCELAHKWTVMGEYVVRVRAADDHGWLYGWSDPLPITVPRDKSVDKGSNISIFVIGSGLYCIMPPLYYMLNYGSYNASGLIKIRDWRYKPFTYPTSMIIGSGVGYKPNVVAMIPVFTNIINPDLPFKVRVFSDGEYYDTLEPMSILDFNIYVLLYDEKGFHHLEFIADDNSSSAEMDIQVGFDGFKENILPYLIKPFGVET